MKKYMLYWRTQGNRNYLLDFIDLAKAMDMYEKVASRPSTRIAVLNDVTDRSNVKTIKEKED